MIITFLVPMKLLSTYRWTLHLWDEDFRQTNSTTCKQTTDTDTQTHLHIYTHNTTTVLISPTMYMHIHLLHSKWYTIHKERYFGPLTERLSHSDDDMMPHLQVTELGTREWDRVHLLWLHVVQHGLSFLLLVWLNGHCEGLWMVEKGRTGRENEGEILT